MMSEVKEQLIKDFMEHVVLEGEKPKTVFAFCKKLEMEEAEFYKHYSGFESLEKAILIHLFSKTIDIVEGDEAFAEYSARERYLAFNFTLVEQLKKNLSYYRVAIGHPLSSNPLGAFAKAVKSTDSFILKLVEYGEDTGEVAKREFLKKLITKGFQLHLVFVIKFLKDDSAGFETTDQAIEKSTHLLFDALGKGVVDSAFDFAKFMGQNAMA